MKNIFFKNHFQMVIQSEKCYLCLEDVNLPCFNCYKRKYRTLFILLFTASILVYGSILIAHLYNFLNEPTSIPSLLLKIIIIETTLGLILLNFFYLSLSYHSADFVFIHFNDILDIEIVLSLFIFFCQLLF